MHGCRSPKSVDRFVTWLPMPCAHASKNTVIIDGSSAPYARILYPRRVLNTYGRCCAAEKRTSHCVYHEKVFSVGRDRISFRLIKRS